MNLTLSFNDIRTRNYFIFAASSIGFVLAWLLRDNYEHPFLVTIFIWQIQSAGVISCVLVSHITLQDRGLNHIKNDWLKLSLTAIVGCAVFAPIGLLIDIYIVGETEPKTIFLEMIDEFTGYAPPTILIWIALNTPWLLGYTLHKNPLPATSLSEQSMTIETEAATEDKDFYSLLPSNIGKNILYLQSELHYLRVVTDVGECMILFSLIEADKKLPSTSGFMCHRSYWVSRAHISAFKQRGRTGQITLSNGTIIPVSKRKLTEFKKWLG